MDKPAIEVAATLASDPHTGRLLIAWLGVAVSYATLSYVAVVLTLAYTGLQLYRLVRTELRERAEAKAKSAAFAAALAAPESKEKTE